MFEKLPTSLDAVQDWKWDDIAPYVENLKERDLNDQTAETWLKDWSDLNILITEWFNKTRVRTTQDTTDSDAEAKMNFILDHIQPNWQHANHILSEKLLASGLVPDGYAVVLERMRTRNETFNEQNLPLMAQEQKIGMEVAKVFGAQVIEWDGDEKTLNQMQTYLTETDRDLRERAWRAMYQRQLEDREKFNELWVRSIDLREQMRTNAGYDNYRDFRWKQFARLDYGPEDNEQFHHAIETVVVPAATRLNEKRRAVMGLDTLRPWDLVVDPQGRAALKPYETTEEFINKGQRVFDRVDEQIGHFYGIMAEEDLLDLGNRKNKGPGGYCTTFPLSQRAFIFMNGVGAERDVRTLLHEMGHASHNFLSTNLQAAQRYSTIEFAEVAAMSLELLSAPYLVEAGFFDANEAARWRTNHLEKIIHFWPYMAVVDAFQLWAGMNPDDARDPANCDRVWGDLWDRFIPSQDWSGLDDYKVTGWHRKHHIFRYPFYYVEYGIAQTGAVQVWSNALEDQAGAVANYKRALSLGGTVSLPELWQAAGGVFDFSVDTMKRQVDLIEKTLDELAATA